MALGFQFLPNTGCLVVEMVVYEHKTLGKQMARLFTFLAEALNPLGGSSSALQIAAPTVLDAEPGFKCSRDSATPWARGFAEAINAVAGGTDHTPGGWSPTPDQIR